MREAILLAALSDATPRSDVVVDAEDIQALTRAAEKIEKKSRLRFSDLKIPTEAELVFIRDDRITCRVIADGQVEYEGAKMSPSAAALTAIKKLGYTWSTINGSDFWMFEGETLSARRLRLEDENE